MRVLPRFEANLLRILHLFLQRAPLEQALPLILDRWPQPPCLSRSCVELVQDSLAKGCVLLLARGGGWRKERHLRGDRVAAGRLWQRTPPQELGLVFSPEALRFLLWITRAKPGEGKPQWNPPADKLTVADLLLCYLAYTALRETNVARVFQKMAPFAGNGLCQLAYSEDFANNEGTPAVDFTPWTTGLGGCILEALQWDLARKWEAAERRKGTIKDGQAMRQLGRGQEAVLTRFLPAAEAAGRLDLARFLFRTAAALLTESVTPAFWVGALEIRTGRLADRAETYQAALALVRQLPVFRQWQQRARSVGYFDEGYGAAQLWKEEWEHYSGEQLYARAQAVIRRLDPMNLFSGG
jgi:hypothetical protein